MNNPKKKVGAILFNLLLWLLFVGLSFYLLEKNWLFNNRCLDIIFQIAIIFLAALVLIPSQYDRAPWLIKAKKIAIMIFIVAGIGCLYYALWWRALLYFSLMLFWPIEKNEKNDH